MNMNSIAESLDIPRCIICKKEIVAEEHSKEHIIPDALGGVLEIESVCRSCNSKLGEKVDTYLVDDPLFVYLRCKFGVKTKKGKTVDITHRLEFEYISGEKAIIKNGDGDNMPIRYDGTRRPEVDITQNGNTVNVKVSGSDFESIIKKTKKELKAKGYSFSDSEIETCIYKNLVIQQSWSLVRTQIKYNKDCYAPCVLKMAYEMMCTIFPEKYCLDERGESIRSFLLKMMNDTYYNDFDTEVCGGFDIEKVEYTFAAGFQVENYTQLYLFIILFGGVNFKILVSNNASDYDIERFNNVNVVGFLMKRDNL